MWLRLSIALLILPASFQVAQAQRKKPAVPRAEAKKSDSARAADELARARVELIKATEDYKRTLAPLLTSRENSWREAVKKRDQLQTLYAQGIISRSDLWESEQRVAAAQAAIDEVHKQMKDADERIAQVNQAIAETKAAEQMAKLPAPVRGSLVRTTAYVRYEGLGSWSLSADAGKVSNFFAANFKRALPVSAFGQTSVHDRLGFDHRNAMDVAVHPDSAEGVALIEYLRRAGIPFIAFRSAVSGSATGAHIHIGRPSHRISVAAMN